MGLRKLLRAKLRAAAPKQEQALPLGLQLLFPSSLALGADALTHTLREQHSSLARVRAEVRTGNLGMGMWQVARVQWGRHTVLVGVFNAPIHAETLEWTVELAPYDDAMRERVKAHTAYVALTYKGEETDPLEQYVALGMIAVALARMDAIVVLNASAFTSCPTQLIIPGPGEDLVQVLRTLPLTALFVGFAKFQVEGMEGVWMRTCGAPLMDMPDLALHAQSQDESAKIFYMFNDIFAAMRSAQVRFSAGDMVEDGKLNWKFRKPHPNEGFLHSPRMIVMEPYDPSEQLT